MLGVTNTVAKFNSVIKLNPVYYQIIKKQIWGFKKDQIRNLVNTCDKNLKGYICEKSKIFLLNSNIYNNKLQILNIRIYSETKTVATEQWVPIAEHNFNFF